MLVFLFQGHRTLHYLKQSSRALKDIFQNMHEEYLKYLLPYLKKKHKEKLLYKMWLLIAICINCLPFALQVCECECLTLL